MKRVLVVLSCFVLSIGAPLASGSAGPESLSHYADDEPDAPIPRWLSAHHTSVPDPSAIRAAFSMPGLQELAVDPTVESDFWSDVRSRRLRPTALAAGDFDGDGVPDLVSGYAGAAGDFLTLHRGNVDAIFPYSAAARQRRLEGTLTDSPFLKPARVFDVATRPDFLGVGDFDADGNQDVVLGALGGGVLDLLTGDGAGDLRPAESTVLSGALTALTTGEINRPDGLVDLVAAVAGPDGPVALVFEGRGGALRSEPEAVALPAAATGLALARLHGAAAGDLVVVSGDGLLLVQGRDRRLYLGEKGRAEVGPPEIVRIDVAEPALAVVTGDFESEVEGLEIAALFEEGTLRVFGRGDGTDAWAVLRERSATASPLASHALLAARLSGSSSKEVVVLDTAGQQLVALADGSVLGTAVLESRPAAALPMRLNQDALSDLVVLVDGMAPGVLLSAPRAIITVTRAGDAAVAGDGFCNFREALNNANGNTDTTAGDCATGGGVDTIVFNVGSGSSVVTVAPVSALPAIVDPVVIDGDSQGCPTPPCVVLRGSLAGVGVSGLVLAAGSSVVHGLAIGSFDGDGIGIDSAGNYVDGCFIGTDQTGTVMSGNSADGVSIRDAADNVIGGIGRSSGNVVSANQRGIVIAAAGGGASTSATLNQILNNRVGTDHTGTVALGNISHGIVVKGPDNTVGGLVTPARNLISGNGGAGIRLNQPEATGNLVLGNFIGVDVVGTTALGNTLAGAVCLNGAADNTIGGSITEARNVLSGNTTFGAGIVYDATRNLIAGNYIGTNAGGTAAVPNGYSGVIIEDASDNTIGEVSPGLSNLISGNLHNGIYVNGVAERNQILGNFIGTDVSGTVALGNDYRGVRIEIGTDNAVGGTAPWAGNLISGNGTVGVQLAGGTKLNEVQGNLIGTDAFITSSLGNGEDGVEIEDSSDNLIGGPPGGGNIISGNVGNGIHILNAGSTANQVQGNLIGTDITGTADLGNVLRGVAILDAPDNTIGGTNSGEGNVISGNDQQGVRIWGATATGNVVLGNRIGTDSSGTADLGNSLAGVLIRDTTDNTVGGTTADAANVISGNGTAGVAVVSLEGTLTAANQVLGNLIGTDVTGTILLGNDYDGVIIEDSSDNVVGGASAAAGNLIAGNGECGVEVFETTLGTTFGNAILGNSIVSNVGMGIDHADDGVTTNDAGDPDRGPNLLQNYPVVTLADATPTGITVDGTFNSKASGNFRLEFFVSAECDDSGCGEGERYLGFEDVTTDLSGDAVFSVALPALASDGESITATATDSDNNTSEFADCLAAACQWLATFGQTIDAQDADTLAWGLSLDVRFVKGDLGGVGSYATTGDGALLAATALDISMDAPGSGAGLYYLVRPLGCGSWQTGPSAQPGRDAALP